MASEIVSEICTNCAHASVCPHREAFMKIYHARSNVMVELNSKTKNPDEEVEIRVEHRYMDGPALHQIYREIGLEFAAYPCAMPYSACPIFCRKQPFDSPIMAPWNNPAGYISALCSSARDLQGRQIPFNVDIVKDSTNHQPVGDIPPQWWSCNSCNQCKDKSKNAQDSDYLKIGGSVYSTFGITTVKTTVGSTIQAATIATPKNIAPMYHRDVELNQPEFKINGQDTLIVIYYSHYENVATVDTNKFLTPAAIAKKGLLHNLEFFFGNLSYIYPALTPDTNVDMKVYLEGMICGPISRVNEDMTVTCSPGDFIAFQSLENVIDGLYTSQNEIILTRRDEIMGSINGEMFTGKSVGIKYDVDMSKYELNITRGNYRKIQVVEGDKIIIKLIVPASYKLDMDLMQTLTFPARFSVEYTDELTKDKLSRVYRILLTMPKDEVTLQTCLVDESFFTDDAGFPKIRYDKAWENDAVAWSYHFVTAMNDTVKITVAQPIAPRMWSAGAVFDKTPNYSTDVPDGPGSIMKPYFSLTGYTSDFTKRASFNPFLEIRNPVVCTYPKEVRFTKTGKDAIDTYLAMWQIIYKEVDDTMKKSLTSMGYPEIPHEVPPEGEPFQTIIPVTIDPRREAAGRAMKSIYPVQYLDLQVLYSPTMLIDFYNQFKKLNIPHNYIAKLYTVQQGRTLVLANNYPESENDDHSPLGVVEIDRSGEKLVTPLFSCEINDSNVASLQLSPLSIMIIMVYPKDISGLSIYDQNFVVFQSQLKMVPSEISVSFIYDGKIMFDKAPDLSMAKGYTFTNVDPKDAPNLSVNIVDGLPVLAGSAAQFYHIKDYSIIYRQSLTLHTLCDNVCMSIPDSGFSVPYKGAYSLDLTAPAGYSFHQISVNDLGPIFLYDRKDPVGPSMTDSSGSYSLIKVTKDKYTLKVWDIATDVAIHLILHKGDDGTVLGCSRCADYVDTKEYPWLSWVPNCIDFKN